MARLRPYPVEENFEQWVTNRFGKRLYHIFFKTYTEKVWGIPCTEIRAEWAAQRIQGLSLAKAILNATALTKRIDQHQDADPRVPVPPARARARCGRRAATASSSMGHAVLMRHWVDAHRDASRAGSSPCARRRRTGERRFAADHVISTMPVRSLVRALDAGRRPAPSGPRPRACGTGTSSWSP